MHLSLSSLSLSPAAPASPGAHARLRDPRAATMAKALIAIIVFTLLGAAVLAASSATRTASASVEQAAVAESIALDQIEIILAAPYEDPPHTYTPISTPPGYAVTAEARELVVGDRNIAMISVAVTLDGVPVLTIESIRTKAQ